MRVVVTGASGNVGLEVVAALLDAGHDVRAVVRSTGRGEWPDGVDVFVGDLNQPVSLRPAWSGAQAAFILPGYPAMLLADARAAGVQRVVQLSGSSAEDATSNNVITRYMTTSERNVRGSGIAFTILRPCAFMSNTLQWVAQLRAGDIVRAPFADVAAAVIDPYDIGRVAAVVATAADDRHDGQVYRLSGPAALRPADRVAILADVLGRPLRFEAQPNPEAYAELSAQMPIEYVDAFFDFYVKGTIDESVLHPTVAQLTGKPPRPFHAWAQTHAASFAAQ